MYVRPSLGSSFEKRFEKPDCTLWTSFAKRITLYNIGIVFNLQSDKGEKECCTLPYNEWKGLMNKSEIVPW